MAKDWKLSYKSEKSSSKAEKSNKTEKSHKESFSFINKLLLFSLSFTNNGKVSSLCGGYVMTIVAVCFLVQVYVCSFNFQSHACLAWKCLLLMGRERVSGRELHIFMPCVHSV